MVLGRADCSRTEATRVSSCRRMVPTRAVSFIFHFDWERQLDGRYRFWRQIPDLDGRYLRVVLLNDGRTVHNAFPDRGFVP